MLRIFYSAESVDAVVKGLPQNMPATDTAIIASRWPFFKAMRDDAIGTDYQCYVRMSLFKSVYQSVYNSLKGGLDANMQQYISIHPKVSVSFEAKYILQMLLSIVSNAW